MITQKIYTTDIKDRIDPYYYQPEFIEIKKKLEKLKLKKIKDISTNLKNGSTPKGGVFEESGIPYFRSQDFDLFDFETRQFITPEFHKKLSRSAIKANDILVAVVGATLGVVGYVPNEIQEGNINQNVARIRIKDNEINPKYLAIFLASRVGQKSIFRNATITTQSYLNNQQLGEIEIPTLEKRTQDKIVELITTAYQIQKEKLKQANELLNSIDGYVREQLGIDYIEPKEGKIYTVNSQDLENNRHDPLYHNPVFVNKYQTIKSSQYSKVTLGDIIIDVKNGVEIRKYADSGYRYLRVTDLGEHGLNNNNPRFVAVNKIPEKIKLTKNDFLISRSGSLGLVSVVKEEIIDSILSSHIFKLRLKTDQVIPDYLELFLRSILGQFQFFQKNNGGIVPEINQSALKTILIVLPPLNKQKGLADNITVKYRKAEDLKTEASKVLEDAKEKVEQMILI